MVSVPIEVLQRLYKILKGMGAKCDIYAPPNAPRLECRWDDGVRVVVWAFKSEVEDK